MRYTVHILYVFSLDLAHLDGVSIDYHVTLTRDDSTGHGVSQTHLSSLYWCKIRRKILIIIENVDIFHYEIAKSPKQ